MVDTWEISFPELYHYWLMFVFYISNISPLLMVISSNPIMSYLDVHPRNRKLIRSRNNPYMGIPHIHNNIPPSSEVSPLSHKKNDTIPFYWLVDRYPLDSGFSNWLGEKKKRILTDQLLYHLLTFINNIQVIVAKHPTLNTVFDGSTLNFHLVYINMLKSMLKSMRTLSLVLNSP